MPCGRTDDRRRRRSSLRAGDAAWRRSPQVWDKIRTSRIARKPVLDPKPTSGEDTMEAAGTMSLDIM
jgi:hypothetical protein